MFLARPILTRQRFSRITAFAASMLLSACLQTTQQAATPQARPAISAQQNQAYSSPALSAPQAANAKKIVKVGLLLPLSGRNSDLGRALQNAATLALYDRYAAISPQLAETKVELLPKDTGDTAETARDAAKQAINDGASLLIGPVFSDSVQAVAPIAKQAGVPVISFSNNPSVASDGVYIFGFSPEAQTKRVVSYALERGMPSMAALVPDSPYGQSVLTAATQALEGKGQTIRGQAIYDAQGVGLDNAIGKLLPANQNPEFAALFLPEGSAALDTIIRTLDARGLRNNYQVQLLGTGLWDDSALTRRVNLEGAWFASSPPTLTQAFEQRFNATYNYSPPRIASLGYDAVSLAVTLATGGREFDKATLTHAGGFSGPANGIFRLNANGTSDRGLSVVQIKAGKFEIISPAPDSFLTQ